MGYALILMLIGVLASSMDFCGGVGMNEVVNIIHVGGKVLCQDCSQGYNQWIQDATPIKGSKVAITCMDERKRVMHYRSDETDEEGEYDLIFNKFNFKGKELNLKLCSIRLVSSPHPTCKILTNFGGGQSGVKLLTPTSIYRDTIKYIIPPFYYTTPLCDKPDVTYDQDQGTNY